MKSDDGGYTGAYARAQGTQTLSLKLNVWEDVLKYARPRCPNRKPAN